MDLQMPEMNGFEDRTHRKTMKSTIPIIALTADKQLMLKMHSSRYE
jgi:CheY-like chemotaxis protein